MEKDSNGNYASIVEAGLVASPILRLPNTLYHEILFLFPCIFIKFHPAGIFYAGHLPLAGNSYIWISFKPLKYCCLNKPSRNYIYTISTDHLSMLWLFRGHFGKRLHVHLLYKLIKHAPPQNYRNSEEPCHDFPTPLGLGWSWTLELKEESLYFLFSLIVCSMQKDLMRVK